MGGHSLVVTDFCLRASGFEHIVVLAEPGTPETRAGRICQRLLEMENYRLMALRLGQTYPGRERDTPHRLWRICVAPPRRPAGSGRSPLRRPANPCRPQRN